MYKIMHSVDKKKQDIKLIINSETMKGIVDFLLGEINPRSKLVLEMRFGLGGEKPRSLNFIGVKLNITRERVRQIEVDSFKRLKELKKTQEYEAVISRVIKIIDFHGGFCEKRKLKEEIKKNVNDLERSYLMIILNSSTRLKFEKANKRTEAFWFNEKTTNVKTVASCVEEIIKFMQTKKEPVKFDEILKFALNIKKDFFIGDLGRRRLRMILYLSRNLQKNILKEWGWKKWNLISGKGSRERAYLVLRKYKESMHFRQLADKINKNFRNKLTLPQTVHNELIKDGRFIQVGKGTYGLAEWGLVQGTVKDVIMRLLEKRKKALQEEIIDYVMSQKKVKKTTIVVNLADQNFFNRDEEGNYFLI